VLSVLATISRTTLIHSIFADPCSEFILLTIYKAIIKQKEISDEDLKVMAIRFYIPNAWVLSSSEAFKEVINACESAEDQFSEEKEIATAVKKGLDANLTGTWQVVVGRTFGSSLHHEENSFAYTYLRWQVSCTATLPLN